MANEESYDYSQSLPFITEFQNPIPEEPFIDELQENYGTLWQFKDCVDSWTLGVSRFKKYVYLLHREMPTGPFLPLNIGEKVTLLENFHQEYVVITLQAVSSSGEDTDHLHLIVVKIGEIGAAFDIDGLLQKLDGTSMEVLQPKLQAKYAPWTYTSPESAYRKIKSIYRNLSQYAAQSNPSVAPRPLRPQPQAAAEGRATSQSRTQGRRSHAQLTAPARAERRKRNAENQSESEPIRSAERDL